MRGGRRAEPEKRQPAIDAPPPPMLDWLRAEVETHAMNAFQNENDNALIRQSLLTSPDGERRDVEYKASVKFDPESDFGLKLVKHILGMANIGGGWIVIGHEDGSLRPDPKHTNEVTDTYDPTKLTAAVKSVVAPGQPVRLVVHRERNPRTRLVYPIIRVEGFERIPFICRSTKPNKPNQKPILQQHKVYVRTWGAETTEIQTPKDWDELIDLCVAQRMVSSNATPSEDPRVALENWMDECKAASSALQSLPAGYGYMEFAQMPTRTSSGRWSRDDLWRAAAESIAWPYERAGWLKSGGHLRPTQEGVGLQASDTPNSPPHALHIRSDGAFYVCVALAREDYGHPPPVSPPPPGRPMYIDLATYRIAWMNEDGVALYEALRIVPDEPYLLCIRHSGILDRVSSIYTQEEILLNFPEYRKSRVPSHKWQEEVTLSFAKENGLDLLARIANSLFELFDFIRVPHSMIDRAFSFVRSHRKAQ